MARPSNYVLGMLPVSPGLKGKWSTKNLSQTLIPAHRLVWAVDEQITHTCTVRLALTPIKIYTIVTEGFSRRFVFTYWTNPFLIIFKSKAKVVSISSRLSCWENSESARLVSCKTATSLPSICVVISIKNMCVTGGFLVQFIVSRAQFTACEL